MTSNPFLFLPIAEITRLYARKELSPVDLARASLDTIETLNPALNFVTALNKKQTMKTARASEARWLKGAPQSAIDGIPATVKDWYDVKGFPTYMGSKLSGDGVRKESAIPVERLLDAGAVIVAKTTLPEYGHKGVTDSPRHGITRNPWNINKTPGGSSGGAAVAAACGVAPLNLGSDAGGSVRIPASFCGVFAMKPSQGLVPSWPPSLFSTLSSAGPLTRHARDAALMLDVITKPDPRDWHALPLPPMEFAKALGKKMPRLKIAYAHKIEGVSARPDVVRVLRRAREIMASAGDIHDVRLDIEDTTEVFNRHWMAVAAHIARKIPAADKKKMDPRFLHWAARGSGMTLDEYLWAERRRMDIGAFYKNLLQEYDLLITPTTAMTAFDAGQNMPQDKSGRLWDNWTPFTYPANLARLPAASVNAGFTSEGLPVGLQIMGGYLKDALVMQAADFFQKNDGGIHGMMPPPVL